MSMNLKSSIKSIARKRMFPLVVCLLALATILPLFGNLYLTHLAILILTYAAVSSAWNLTIGYAGMFNWAHTAFFTVGAYIGANMSFIGVPPLLSIIVAGLVLLPISLAISFPLLRFKGIYLCLFTFAFWQFIAAIATYPPLTPWTGGSFGLVGVPDIFGGGTLLSKPFEYYLALILFLSSFWIIYKVINSRFGLGLASIRESESFAKSRGVNCRNIRTLVFITGSCIAGMMGSFYAHYLNIVDYRFFGWDFTWLLLAMVIVGGIKSIRGPIMGAVIITSLSEFTRHWLEWRNILLGVFMLLMMIFMSGGLVQVLEYIKRTLLTIKSKIGGLI